MGRKKQQETHGQGVEGFHLIRRHNGLGDGHKIWVETDFDIWMVEIFNGNLDNALMEY